MKSLTAMLLLGTFLALAEVGRARPHGQDDAKAQAPGPSARASAPTATGANTADPAFLLQRRYLFGEPLFDFIMDSGHHDMLEDNPALRDGILAGTVDFVPQPEDKRKYYGEYALTGWWQRNQWMFRRLHALAYHHEAVTNTHWSEPFVERTTAGKVASVSITIPKDGDYYVWVLRSGKGRFSYRGLIAGGGRNPSAWYWMRLWSYADKTSLAFPEGEVELSFGAQGDSSVRLAAVMLVDAATKVSPAAPKVPVGEGIIAHVLHPDDRQTRIGEGVAWRHEPKTPAEADRYAQAVIVALKEIGAHYLNYPRMDWRNADAERGRDAGPHSHFSALGYHALQEAWMMAVFIRVWDRMRFWEALADDDYLAIMQTFILPAAEYMFRQPLGGHNNMAIETRSRVSYWALLLGRDDWLAALYEGDLGFKAQIKHGFSEEGWSFEGHYHSHAVEPLLFWAEMYVKTGYPADEIYNSAFKRVFDAYLLKAPFWNGEFIVQSATAAERFGDPVLARFNTPDILAGLPSANLPSLGFTALRRNVGGKPHAVGMNWGINEKRGCPDRLGVFISAPFFSVYRMAYNHLSVDQATIVVDSKNQKPARGNLDQYVPHGEATIIAASNHQLYDGVAIHRTAISLGSGAFLVVDRCASETEHTYDWPGTGIQQPDGIEFAEQENALGTTNGYDGYHAVATVDTLWGVRDTGKAILVLPWPGTLLARKTHAEPWRGTTTLIRRAGTTVDAAIAYVPTTDSATVDFRWLAKEKDRVVVLLHADGADWLVTVDYAAEPERRCTVTRR